MNKVYYQSMAGNGILLLFVLLGVAAIIISLLSRNLLQTTLCVLGTLFMVYIFLAAGLYFRISLDEKGIRVDSHNLTPQVELEWQDVSNVVNDAWLGMKVYHLIPSGYGKNRITFPWSIANCRCLLKDIVDNSPNAKVDRSIIEVIKLYS